MVFSEKDKILIKNLYVYKGYSAKQLIDDFPENGWKLRSLNYLLKKLRETDVTHVDYTQMCMLHFTRHYIDILKEMLLSLMLFCGKFIKVYVCQKLLEYSLV